MDEAEYICPSCGEPIVIPIDVSIGVVQEYTEDCPVCCHPVSLRITCRTPDDIHVDAEHE
ncbi:CPXCG motif-containing cysteine-rich protein [Maioricimonas sp. JC845]|uniref:CPXCG motif-containing cysteine-rich protein n=1 Tax=Maioricimonas sp. JC845 TaxID=3232138 RepID=UPI0034582B1C